MFEKEKREIIKGGLKLDRYGLVSLAGGNLSMRMPSGEILITPSGMIYEDMVEDDVVVMDVNGNIIEGDRKPSSDTEGILYIFRERPDVMAVIHTHQPYATAISLIQDEFRADLTTLGNACRGNRYYGITGKRRDAAASAGRDRKTEAIRSDSLTVAELRYGRYA